MYKAMTVAWVTRYRPANTYCSKQRHGMCKALAR
jgi:hypothetical protein